jgi:hypothetical protein
LTRHLVVLNTKFKVVSFFPLISTKQLLIKKLYVSAECDSQQTTIYHIRDITTTTFSDKVYVIKKSNNMRISAAYLMLDECYCRMCLQTNRQAMKTLHTVWLQADQLSVLLQKIPQRKTDKESCKNGNQLRNFLAI